MTVLGIFISVPVAFAAGLVVGWWFLPQPGFIRWIGRQIGIVKT